MTQEAQGAAAGKDPFLLRMLKLASFGAAFASIPLFAAMENLQPPWPTSVAYVSAACILAAALIARQFGPGLSGPARGLMLILAASLSVVGLFAYLYLYSRFVFSVQAGERIILGYSCNGATQQAYAHICPNLTAAELARAGYDPDLLYTKDSLDRVRLALVGAWMLFTTGLMAAVGWAVSAPRLAAEAR